MVERESIRRDARRDLTACAWGVTFYFFMVLALFALLGGHFSLGILAGGFTVVTGVMFIRLLTRPAEHLYNDAE
jgi:hypothetical protein